jgi:hypothetical protein
VDRVLDRTGYELVREAEQATLDAASAALATLAPAPAPLTWPSLTGVLAQVGAWQGALAAADLAAVRPVLAQLIHYITPHRAQRGRPIPEIAWTPLGAALTELAATVRQQEEHRLTA